jgi:hypothetical protein
MNAGDVLQLLEKIQITNEMYLALIIEDGQDPKVLLDIVNEAGFCSYLRTTSVGTEVIIAAKR